MNVKVNVQKDATKVSEEYFTPEIIKNYFFCLRIEIENISNFEAVTINACIDELPNKMKTLRISIRLD